MKKLSISTKITLWYMFFLIVITAAMMTALLRLHDLKEQNAMERRLVQTVEDASDIISGEGQEFIYDGSIRYYVKDTYVSVYDGSGSLLIGRRPAGFSEFPQLGKDSVRVVKDSKGGEWYVYDTTVSMDEGEDLLIRGMMNNIVYEDDSFLFRFFLVSLPVLMILAAAGGWLITRQTLSPLRGLIKVTDEIRLEGDLSKRVPEAESSDEISALTRSFNSMFDSIEAVVDREKQFTSDVAHELRTPLAVIRSQSEYAMEDPGYAPEAAAVINRESRRMSDLVSRLLMLARSDAGRLEPASERTDLAELLCEVTEQAAEGAAEKGVEVTFRNASGKPAVYVMSDADLIIRIILNLTDNAVKYGRHPGGRVEVRLALSGDGRAAICTVADDGEGIDRAERQKIWQRFYQSDAARSRGDSAGLGLSMAESLAKALGGSIRYVDEEDRADGELEGAVFELELPLPPDKEGRD